MLKENSSDPAGFAVQLAFGRPATEKERTKLNAFLDSQAARYKGADAQRKALADLCQAIFALNEFIYVD